MTPKRFAKLVERFNELQQREDRRAGEVAAMLYNANRTEETKPIDWRDVFPQWQEEEEQSEEEMLRVMQMWAAATKHLPS